MKASTRWLSEILDTEIDPHGAAEQLTQAGIEIEEVIDIQPPPAGVVTAEIVEKSAHPRSDRLHLVKVYDGAGHHQVVCGAPNTPGPGSKVILARTGTRISGVELSVRKIKGIESSGMLCSEQELDIGPDGSGILILDGDQRPGVPLRDIHDFSDSILEYTITPNRPDCLGHLGLAREVAALLGIRFRLPESDTSVDVLDEPSSELASVTIEDPTGCPRYDAAVLRGVKVTPSPLPLKYRLHVLGIRPISNIVDVTNWILLYDNQPLHAFDLRLLPDGIVIVRTATPGEKIVTLDEIPRTLESTDLVIASRERPVAVAGVMGGEGTAIGDDTTDVLIECAYFDPNCIRRTSARLHLQTEASYRFERGTDPGPLPVVVKRAASMMARLGGGAMTRDVIDVYPKKIQPVRVPFRVDRAERIVGTRFDADRCLKTLRTLGCSVQDGKQEDYHVTAPTFRPDLTREIDLIEEVARLRGYDTIDATLPLVQASKPQRSSYDTCMRFKRAFASSGLDEVVTLSFASSKRLEELGLPGKPVALANPLNSERDVMRNSLLPGLLEILAYHASRSRNSLGIFELGTVFARGDDGLVEGIEEHKEATGLVYGPRRSWIGERRGTTDFHDAWGALLHGLTEIWSVEPRLARYEQAPAWLHPRSACTVECGGEAVGWIGELHPAAASRLDLPEDKKGNTLSVGLFSVRVTDHLRSFPKFKAYSDMPVSERDLAVIFPVGVEAGQALSVIRRSAGELLESATLFDVFAGGKIPQGFKSMAFRMTLRAEDRTLTQKEVDEVIHRVLSTLEENLDGKVRL